MNKKRKSRLLMEIILTAAVLVIAAVVLKHHAPKIIQILETGSVSDIDAYLQSEGRDGRLLLVLMQVIETLSIILPAMPVYICAGILYGKLAGIAVCYLVNLILNLFMFLTGRKMSAWTKKHFDLAKNQTVSHLVSSARHLDRVVAAMCLLPIVPNGTIPFLAAQTNITVGQYMMAIAVGSLPSIIVNVCFGDILLSDSWKIILPVIIVIAVLAALIYIFRKKVLAYLEPKLKKFIEG